MYMCGRYVSVPSAVSPMFHKVTEYLGTKHGLYLKMDRAIIKGVKKIMNTLKLYCVQFIALQQIHNEPIYVVISLLNKYDNGINP